MSKISHEYSKVRNRTTALCEPLLVEDYLPQGVVFTSPPKWHLAHTTWFFEELILKKYCTDYTNFNDSFNLLFNSYYNTIGKRVARNHRGLLSRPTVDEIYDYRKYVDDNITKLLSDAINKEIEELLLLGINHEQQHQELLLTDLKYTLSLNPINPIYDPNCNMVDDINDTSGWLNISEGNYEIGHNSKAFSFDNELGRHKVYIHDFSISKSLVTNAEFVEFIEDGGYTNFQFWLDDGWSWVQNETIQNPLYWQRKNGTWFNFTLAGLKPLNPAAILSHISFYEASAFAAWKGMRLPTELEWEVASNKLDWGKRWEWTNSAYLPYPQFKIAEGAVGEYNGKFMINQMVLRGSSVATAKGHSRNTYRNFFQPHYQWQYAGIRLIK